ncbi:MAG: hypothetical protein WBO46_10540 [Caldilineaceae bacterium]
MVTKIKLAIAILVILASGYWAFDGVRTRTLVGSKLTFDVGNGYVVLNNLGKDPITAEMRSEGTTNSFRISSTELGLNETSKRQGSGRTAYHTIPLEIPKGTARIDVTRGQQVQFVATSTGRMRAEVNRLSPATAQVNIRVAGVAILLSLLYISHLYRHQWVRALFRPVARLRTRRSAA